MKNMAQTSTALQNSKWLTGAKIIYDVVKSKRMANGQETKPFIQWLGIGQFDADRFVAGQYTYIFVR